MLVAFGTVFLIALLVFIILTNPFTLINMSVQPQIPAILLGLIIILGASVLVLLLFVMAAGFNALGLNNPDESLGLPKGTVRAMIALLLIIVWVIVSIYLFIVIPNTAITAVSSISGTPTAVSGTPTPASTTSASATPTAVSGSPSAMVVTNAVADTSRLAEELYATMSTLVVAIVGFYFGSKAAAPAGKGASSNPVLIGVVPDTGAQGATIDHFTIIGQNIPKTPNKVRFFLDKDNSFEAENIVLTGNEKIVCKVPIPADRKAGPYDVVVVIDGVEYTLSKAFTVTTP